LRKTEKRSRPMVTRRSMGLLPGRRGQLPKKISVLKKAHDALQGRGNREAPCRDGKSIVGKN